MGPKVWQFPEASDRKQNPRMPEKQTSRLERETLSHSAVTTWIGKTSFSPAVRGGKPRFCLAARWLILPPVDLQTHLSFTFDTRQTFLSDTCWQRTRPPKSSTWRKTVSRLAAAYIKNTNWTYHSLLKTLTWTNQPPKTTRTFQHLIWETWLFSLGSGRPFHRYRVTAWN